MVAGPAEATAGPDRSVRLRPQDRVAWDELVSEALGAFEAGHLRKVVLARAIELEASDSFDVPATRARLRAMAGPAVGYELRADDGTTLLGASPERLFTLEAGRLETQALASSAAPGELERLTGGHKEAREHAAVVESIRAALLPLSAEVEIGTAPSRSPSATSRTSARPSARAFARRGPADVVRALHPTAAVGGTRTRRSVPPEPRTPCQGLVRRGHRLAGGRPGRPPGRAPLRPRPRPGGLAVLRRRLVRGSTAEGEWTETA